MEKNEYREMTPGSHIKGPDASVLSRGLGENCILLDSRLKTLGIGENVRRAIGSVAEKDDISGFLQPADAFRLEEFAGKSSSYAGLSSLELTLSGVPGFSHACACRCHVFGADTVLLTLYANKRDFLLTHESMAAFNFPPLTGSDIPEKIESAHRMISIFAETHPDEAAILRSTVDGLIRKALASSIIFSILSQSGDTSPVYDPAALADRATEHVKGALSGADLAFSHSAASGGGISAPDIPAEHMWYLTTCVLTTAVRMSGHGRTVLNLLTEDGRLIMYTDSPNTPFGGRLPERMTLSEFRNIVPASALRLYLCDLICTEYGVTSEVLCTGDVLKIRFSFRMRGGGRSFHRFDPVFPVAEWEHISEAVIIPDVDAT